MMTSDPLPLSPLKKTGLYLLAAFSFSLAVLFFCFWNALSTKISMLSPECLNQISSFIRTVLALPLFGKVLGAACMGLLHLLLFTRTRMKYSEKMLAFTLLSCLAALWIAALYYGVVVPVMEYKLSLKASLSSL
jgi:hypothetical protein